VARYRSAMRLSPDGRYWWDGTAWRDADHVAPPLVTRSPDGLYWWDGAGWRVNRTSAAGGTNGYAIASLVLGILWLFWIGSVLAVIFGHIALNQVHRNGQSGRGLAIAGLVLGYIGLALFVVGVIGASLGVHSGTVQFGPTFRAIGP
jgi:hypothetical protein